MVKKNKKTFKNDLNYVKIAVFEWLRKTDNTSAVFIFIVSILTLTYISMPNSFTMDIPVKQSDVGKIMKFSLRAEKDYKIIDEEETAKNRIIAENNVPLQFIHINNDIYYKKVHKAFSKMRKSIVLFLKNKIAKNKKKLPPEFLEIYTLALIQNKELIPESWQKELKKKMEEDKSLFDTELGFTTNKILYNSLFETFFSKTIESYVFNIVERLNNYYIYRIGLPKDYKLKKITIKKNNFSFDIPTTKLITESSLKYEIKHAETIFQFNKQLPKKGEALVSAFAYWIIKNNVIYSKELTEKKKLESWNNAPQKIITIKSGEILRRAGETITKRDIKIFNEIVKQMSEKSAFSIFSQNLIFLGILILILFFAFKKSIKKFSVRNKDLILISANIILSFIFYNIIVSLSIPFSNWMGNIDARIFYFLLPMPFLVAIIRLLINSETAIFFVLTESLSLLLVFPSNFYFPVYYVLTSVVFLFLITHIEKRSFVIKKTFLLGLISMGLTLLFFLMDRTLPFSNVLKALLMSFLGAFISGFLILGSMPLWEWLLGYTTDITFLEYTTLNHPIMKDMAIRANGTYQHSLTVGTIVESAASKIGLSPLACKAMAYFHDIGKLERPNYFAENQTNSNKHEELSPSMSAKIIINHVKQGVEIARKYNLGDKIESAITQHHGTSLIRFFYSKAHDLDPKTQEEYFRYPGPKPQTKEVALIMLADSCEAGVRSLKEKNYETINDMVTKIFKNIIDDGQLNQCNITLEDIYNIKTSFISTFSGLYHARIEYPDQNQKR